MQVKEVKCRRCHAVMNRDEQSDFHLAHYGVTCESYVCPECGHKYSKQRVESLGEAIKKAIRLVGYSRPSPVVTDE